VARPR